MTFIHMLKDAWQRNDSLVCVGLDPEPAKFPAHLRDQPDAIFEFCRAIVDATADLVCCFKPQIAHFAAHARRRRARTPDRAHPRGAPARARDPRRQARRHRQHRRVLRRRSVRSLSRRRGHGESVSRPRRAGTFSCRVRTKAWSSCAGPRTRARATCRISTSAAASSISTSRRRLPREWNANGNCLLVVGATYPARARRGPRDRRRHAAARAGCRRAGRRCRGRRFERLHGGRPRAHHQLVARDPLCRRGNRVRERRKRGDENPRHSDQSASLIP